MSANVGMDAKVDVMSAIFNNAEVMEKISNSATKEDMQKIFAENGMVLTIDEVSEFIHFMNNAVNDTLDEEELDRVAGGAGVTAVQVFSWAWKGVKKVARKCWEAGRWAANNGW